MAGFWAGFGSTVSKGIDDRLAFTREETARRQEYLRTVGVPAIQQRNAKIQDSMNEINQAVSLGLRQDVAVAAWESGTLPAVVESIVSAGDKSQQAAEHFNTIQELTADYTRRAENPEEVVRTAFGAATAKPIDFNTEEGRNANIFEVLFAVDPQGAADRSMEDYTVGGYTEAEASAAIGAGDTRKVSTPAGYRYSGVPTTSTRIGPEDIRPQQNAFRTTFSTYTGDTAQYIGDNVVIAGQNKQATEMAANKATTAYFKVMELGTMNPVDAQALINQLAYTLLYEPTKASPPQAPDFASFYGALEMLQSGATVEDLAKEFASNETEAPPPNNTAVEETGGMFDPSAPPPVPSATDKTENGFASGVTIR